MVLELLNVDWAPNLPKCTIVLLLWNFYIDQMEDHKSPDTNKWDKWVEVRVNWQTSLCGERPATYSNRAFVMSTPQTFNFYSWCRMFVIRLQLFSKRNNGSLPQTFLCLNLSSLTWRWIRVNLYSWCRMLGIWLHFLSNIKQSPPQTFVSLNLASLAWRWTHYNLYSWCRMFVIRPQLLSKIKNGSLPQTFLCLNLSSEFSMKMNGAVTQSHTSMLHTHNSAAVVLCMESEWAGTNNLQLWLNRQKKNRKTETKSPMHLCTDWCLSSGVQEKHYQETYASTRILNLTNAGRANIRMNTQWLNRNNEIGDNIWIAMTIYTSWDCSKYQLDWCLRLLTRLFFHSTSRRLLATLTNYKRRICWK